MNEIVVVDQKAEKNGRSLWAMFVNFMENGGILVVSIVVVIIYMMIH